MEGAIMIRELGTIVIAPVALVGYMMATDFHFRPSSKVDTQVDNAAVLQLMSSQTGIGLGVKASSNGLYGLDLQYGLTYQGETWNVSFIPKLGLSATTQTVRELPQDVQFGLGAQILFGYEHYRAGIEIWHLSNGGATAPNIGLNLPIIQVGYAF
jgi:hypothetical protein